MKNKSLTAYLVLVALISGGFIVGMKSMGKSGNYLAGLYMLGPAIAAILTRLFFYGTILGSGASPSESSFSHTSCIRSSARSRGISAETHFLRK
jgi:hypothetical protein